jgi:hypothetical protein
LVPIAMAILWYLEILPGPLALIFQFKTSAAFFGRCSHGVPNSQNRRGEFL